MLTIRLGDKQARVKVDLAKHLLSGESVEHSKILSISYVDTDNLSAMKSQGKIHLIHIKEKISAALWLWQIFFFYFFQTESGTP